MKLLQFIVMGAFCSMLPVSALIAGELTVQVNKISADGIGPSVGTITLRDSHHGMLVSPNLHSLAPGNHAFHIHEHPNCGPSFKDGKKVAGLKAGGHYNPTAVSHEMKHSKDHTSHDIKPHGDLPDLIADAEGKAMKAVMSDKLQVAQLQGRSIMVHRYGTNDQGKTKGGGPRFACGVIGK